MKKLTEKEENRLKILYRRKKHLENSIECLLESLKPILEDLEKVRLEIDEIEL